MLMQRPKCKIKIKNLLWSLHKVMDNDSRFESIVLMLFTHFEFYQGKDWNRRHTTLIRLILCQLLMMYYCFVQWSVYQCYTSIFTHFIITKVILLRHCKCLSLSTTTFYHVYWYYHVYSYYHECSRSIQ